MFAILTGTLFTAAALFALCVIAQTWHVHARRFRVIAGQAMGTGGAVRELRFTLTRIDCTATPAPVLRPDFTRRAERPAPGPRSLRAAA